MAKLNPNDIAPSIEYVGKRFWVCDLRYNDYANKPIRNVEPTLVEVVHNSIAKGQIYYSEVHFRPVNKKGELTAKIIKIFDNTGYRSFSGIPINIFTTEEECNAHYQEQLKTVIAEFTSHKNALIKYYDDLIDNYQNKLE